MLNEFTLFQASPLLLWHFVAGTLSPPLYEEVRGTENEVGRNTLRLALDGRLDRGHFANAVKLARLAASWSKKEVSIMDLLVIEENKASS